jgi:hypothetical protein
LDRDEGSWYVWWLCNVVRFLRSEVLKAVMKITVLWNVTPCSRVDVYHCLRKTWSYHFQGTFLHARWRHHIPLKHQWTFTILHGVTSQKTVIFVIRFVAVIRFFNGWRMVKPHSFKVNRTKKSDFELLCFKLQFFHWGLTLGLLGFWTMFIIQYSKEHCFRNRICFCPLVRGVRHSVWFGRKS